MKNLLLSAVLLCIAFTTQAQFTTGQKMIGGQFSGGLTSASQASSPSKNNSGDVSLALSFSKFKSATQFNTIGFSYSYGHTSSAGTSNEITDNLHAFSIFAERTKLQQLARNFYFTYTGSLTAAYLLNRNKNTISSVVTTDKRNTYSVAASGGIGLMYQLNERFILTSGLSNLLSVNFQHYDVNTTTGTAATVKSPYNSFRLATGLSGLSLNNMSIGFKYLLKKK
jgi:hypothetical protein